MKNFVSLSNTPHRLAQFSEGECPECSLNGVSRILCLNDDDFWECPDCRLQAHTRFPGMLGILESRSLGNLNANPKRELSSEEMVVVCDFETFEAEKIS